MTCKLLMAKNLLPKKNNISKRGGRPRKSNRQRGKGGKSQSNISGPSAKANSLELTLVERSMPLFPLKFRGMLRYADSFALSTTSGTVNTYVFSTNGMFDPNITGTGHQPAGFDQMMVSYEHYTVVKSRIFASFCNTSGNTFPTVAVLIRAGSTPVTVIQQIVEDGMLISQRLVGANSTTAICLLKTACNVAKFGGIGNLLDNPDYKGTIAANPVEQSYYHLQSWSTDGSTAAVTVEVVIEYEAVFTEPRSLTQSLRSTLHRALLVEEKQSSLTHHT